MPNTTPALDEPGGPRAVRAAAPRPGRRCELLAYGAVTVGRAGETLAAARRARRRGGRRASPTTASPVRSASLLRNALAYAGRARAAGRRPPRGRDADRGRRGERRVRRDGARAARLAGRRRGGGRRARPRDPRRRLPRRAGRAAAPHPCLDRRCAGARPAGEGRRPAGHLRRHAASPGAHRRVARRCAPLGVGGGDDGDPWARWATSAIVAAPYDVVAARQPAAALAGGRGRLPRGAASTARPTRSPPTTRRTPSVDKAVEFGLAANGISGIETALGLVLAAVDAGRAAAGARASRR